MSNALPDTSASSGCNATQERSGDKVSEPSPRQGCQFCHNVNDSNSRLLKQQKFEGRCEELNGHVYDCIDASDADVCSQL
jgi:hypothetical protein